jgi:hypothetical protein
MVVITYNDFSAGVFLPLKIPIYIDTDILQSNRCYFMGCIRDKLEKIRLHNSEGRQKAKMKGGIFAGVEDNRFLDAIFRHILENILPEEEDMWLEARQGHWDYVSAHSNPIVGITEGIGAGISGFFSGLFPNIGGDVKKALIVVGVIILIVILSFLGIDLSSKVKRRFERLPLEVSE